MKCENKWYSPLNSGATNTIDCKKKAVFVLNDKNMCERCFNKRTKNNVVTVTKIL